MRPAILAILLIIIAGCVTSAPPKATPTAPVPGTAAGAFLAPINVTKAGGEPGVLLDNDSTVWVHAPGGLWRKGANETNFTQVDFGPGPVFGGDAELAIGADGSLYYSDLADLAALSVFSSHDKGKTWSYQPIASDAPLTDRQWLATAKDASPVTGGGEAVYLAYNQLTSGIWVTKSTDGGLTWQPHPAFPMSSVTEADFQTMGNIVADANGTLYVAFTQGSAGAPITPAIRGYAVIVLSSADGGLTWTPHTVATSPKTLSNIFAIITTDVAGTVYATWAGEMDGSTTEVWLAHSKDHGATWSTPTKVAKNAGSHVLPWVAAGDVPGELVMVWYEANETVKPKDVKGDWHVEMAYTTHGDADAPTFREAQVSPGANHKGEICVDGTVCRSGRQLADFLEARLDAKNIVHVSYADDADGQGTTIEYARSAGPIG